MQSGRVVSRLLVFLTLMAVPFLVGSSCAFFFSSGDGSGGTIVKKDDDDDDEEDPGLVQTGTFSGPAAEGVNFASASLAGVTGTNGEFQYVEGETVRFFIGDITLGAPVDGKPVVSPQDLVAEDAGDAAAAINISRLLRSLDAEPNDDVVTILAEVRSAAVRSNTSISTAIEFLDFSDEVAFVNAASQLVSVLTADYPYTATLVDAERVEDSDPTSPANDPEP